MSAAKYFHRQTRSILEGHDAVVNMIDDILVFDQDRAEHDKCLTEVLDHLKKVGPTLNRLQVQVRHHQHEVSGCGCRKKWYSAGRRRGIRRLLGMVDHVGQFLPHLS